MPTTASVPRVDASAKKPEPNIANSNLVQQRRRLSTSVGVEPSTCGTSWASVRWNRPLSGTYRDRSSRLAHAFEPAISSYSASPARTHRVPSPPNRRYLRPTGTTSSAIRYGSNTTSGLSSQSPMSSTRTSRNSGLTEQGSGVSYLSRATPARSALMDIRQNLRPVKKETDVYQKVSAPRAVPFLSPVSQRTSNFAQYFSPPTFTTGTPSTMAISNVIGANASNRVIPKSERPWRQRLADNARMRSAQSDISTVNSVEDSTSKILAARVTRRPSIGHQSAFSRTTPEQQLQSQLVALRNIVTEDKQKIRSPDGALINPRGSTFSTVGAMPSTTRLRSSFMANSYHPGAGLSPPANHYPKVMSRSYSPIRSSFFSSADSTASTALLHYNQSREKRPEPSSARILAGNSVAKTSEVPSETKADPLESGKKERRRRSRSARRQNSALAAAHSQSSSSSESEQVKHPPRRTSKEPKKMDEAKKVEEVKEVKKGTKGTGSVQLEAHNQKMVVDTSTPSKAPLMKRNLTEEVKSVEKKPLTPNTKRKKKAVEEEPKGVDIVVKNFNGTAKETDFGDDESKYNAVTNFKPASRRKKSPPSMSEAPVPGSWSASDNERFISQNKHLTKKPAVVNVEVVCKELQLQKLPTKSVRLLPLTKKKTLLAKQRLASSGKHDNKDSNAMVVMKAKTEPKALKIIKSIAKPKKLATALAIVNQEFTNKKRLRLGIEKILRTRGIKTESQQLRCQHAKNKKIAILLDIVFREQKRAASVTILSASIVDINWAQVERRINWVKKNKESIKVGSNKENILQKGKRQGKQPSFIKNTHIPCNNYTAGSGGPIVLPDKSLLEEYVQRKRNELENLHNNPEDVFLSVESSKCSSPALLLPVIPEHKPLVVKPEEEEDMIQLMTYNDLNQPKKNKSTINNEGSQQPMFMMRRQLKKPTEVIKPAMVFETPKSLFEERMQNQANQLRKTSQPTSFPVYEHESDQLVEGDPGAVGLRRRSSNGEKGSNVAHNFNLAMAQQQRQHSNERYAAHIPLSGRQSTTSVDSSNSGALDTASRQLDQMLDQARFRHHQHARSKFKEAIDYLDHIFEDLRRECDKDGFPYAEQKIEDKQDTATLTKPTGNRVQAAKAAFQKQQTTGSGSSGASLEGPNRVPLAKTSSTGNWPKTSVSEKPALQKQPAVSKQAPLQFPNQNLKPQKQFSHNAADVEVTETIVLPSKNTSDRLDFTRKWLTDDIKAWAEHPNSKPDLILGSDEQSGLDENNESDEHSLGSCSAEVAAINASEKKKKARETPDLIKSSKTQPKPKKPIKAMKPEQQVPVVGPIRPQPFRPQPQFAIFPPNVGMTDSIYELQKVPSQEQLRSRYSQERATSQDYQSLGSVHSQDGLKPVSCFLSTNSLQRGGAFVNYPQRGSIQSLPDAALLTVNQPQQQAAMRFARVAPNDQTLAVDLLVAELELNTDAPSVSDKRRSFPTTQGEIAAGPAKTETRLGMAKISVQQGPKPGQSSTLGRANKVQPQTVRKTQQTSLDEMADMLREVATDLKPNQQQQSNTPLPRKFSNPRAGLTISTASDKNAANPFETINQERLNPSRVEAISNMFEGSKSGNGVSTWSRKLARNSKDEGEVPNNNHQEKPTKLRSVNIAPIFQQEQEVKLRPKDPQSRQVPFPTAEPTQVAACSSVKSKPATTNNNSANSSQHSGYYSASSEKFKGPVQPTQFNSNNNRPSFKASSRAPSMDEDDDGFYDNVLADQQQRFSGMMSEMDDASLCSQNLPPNQKSSAGRIGQLIRRIGGGAIHKPPVQNAASFVSLNKVANDTPMHTRQHIGLMKSNSLSNEPWRIHAMSKETSGSTESKGLGIGNRLKQTLFGSKKRLQA